LTKTKVSLLFNNFCADIAISEEIISLLDNASKFSS